MNGLIDGWMTCLVRDKDMIYLKSVIYANRQRDGNKQGKRKTRQMKSRFSQTNKARLVVSKANEIFILS
jgi:hypothetical protein